MASIEVDFDVFKELTNRRKTEATTYNDVVRALLKLPAVSGGTRINNGHGWVQKGVTFPNGTDFRATYKGKTHTARVVENEFIFENQPVNSLSEAASRITGNSVNGWRFWECRFPTETTWHPLQALKTQS